MEVGSLTLGLFIIRFKMLLLISLGRALGKYRFLKGWHFLCGRQLMAKFSLWIILCSVVVPWQINCCMCCCNEKSVDHLLIFCPLAHSM